jgi:hypothetical protein
MVDIPSNIDTVPEAKDFLDTNAGLTHTLATLKTM